MPKTFNLNMTNTGFQFLDGNPATSVQVFEGDFINFSTSLQNVSVQVSGNDSTALFGGSSSTIPVEQGTPVPLQVFKSTLTAGAGASANSTYTLSYSGYSTTVYVNTFMFHQDEADTPSEVHLCPQANVYCVSTAGKPVAIQFEKQDNGSWHATTHLFGQNHLDMTHEAPSPPLQVQVSSGDFRIVDKGFSPTLAHVPHKWPDTDGNTITIKVDPSTAGTGVVVGR